MEKSCPHCGFDIKERWHKRYGVQKLEKGSLEAGVPVVGKLEFRREALVLVYVCDLTNLPFLVAIAKTKS